MAASNLDKFLKGARKLAGTIDASGIINLTVDNFGLSSGSGLPTDTGVEIIVDRVDSNGDKTPAKEEVIRGVVSGDRIVDAVRGAAGTAQAHTAGAVWEVMLTTDQWNRMIDGILVGHFQDGTHNLVGHNPDGSHKSPVSVAYTPAGAATATLDLSAANIHKIQMPAGNITIAISNATVGQIFMIEITQDGTGSRIATWFATIKWAGGSAPTLTTAANKRDSFGFEVTGAGTYDGYIIGQNI